MNQLLASDDANREFVGARNPDDLLYVLFYKRAEKNEFQSNLQGKPVFEDRDCIKIMNPGDPNSVIDTYVTEADKKRFPRQWSMYQASQSDEQLIGTPVKEWPAVTRSQAETLKAQGFHTVEQVAGASDLQMQRLGMEGPMLRQKAVAFLNKAHDTAKAGAQAAELAELKKQVEHLTKALAVKNAEANAAPEAKRGMSQEQKDKMAAGRAAAKARKEAEATGP